jgi:hypothetical protein
MNMYRYLVLVPAMYALLILMFLLHPELAFKGLLLAVALVSLGPILLRAYSVARTRSRRPWKRIMERVLSVFRPVPLLIGIMTIVTFITPYLVPISWADSVLSSALTAILVPVLARGGIAPNVVGWGDAGKDRLYKDHRETGHAGDSSSNG